MTVNPPGINHHPALSDEFDVDMCVCGEEWPCSTVRNLGVGEPQRQRQGRWAVEHRGRVLMEFGGVELAGEHELCDRQIRELRSLLIESVELLIEVRRDVGDEMSRGLWVAIEAFVKQSSPWFRNGAA